VRSPRGLWVVVLCAALASADAATPTPHQVEEAAQAVRDEVQVAPSDKRIERRLRWKRDGDETPRETGAPAPPWLSDLVRWLSASGRWLIALLGLAAAIALAVFARRWLRVRAEAVRPPPPVLPSHVRALDIRPDTLPDEIGSAARALWLAGDARAALSLLYRGALSRLVHLHAVPIRAASTEGECLALARGRLPDGAAAYVEQLVAAWQLAVYGARLPAQAQGLALCDGFDAQLSRPREPEAAR